MITRSLYAPTNDERWNQVRDLYRAVRNAESVSKPRMGMPPSSAPQNAVKARREASHG